MAREKSPAFSYYPKDLMSDPRVIAMSGEVFGCYWWLVSACWLDQSIPDSAEECAALCRGKVPSKRFLTIWPEIRACFQPSDDGRLRHGRLERERAGQAESRRRRKDAADKRWREEHAKADAMHTESTCIADAKQCLPSPSPSPSPIPSSTSSALSGREAPPHAHSKPLSYRPRIDVAWPGRPPVPGPLHAEFRERLAGDPNTADARLRAWYPTAADAYADQDIGDDPWKFWNARFREWIGTTVRPVKAVDVPPEFDYDQMKSNLKKRGVL